MVASRALWLAVLVAGVLAGPAVIPAVVHAQASTTPDEDDAVPKDQWRPEFVDRVSKERMQAAFPKGATVTGRAQLGCVATQDGRLTDCKVLREAPTSQGFGEAALGVVGYERIKPKDREGRSVAGRPVRTTFEFLAPGDANPDWVKKPSGADLASVLPTNAAKKGVDGLAVIRCRTTVEGFLEGCRVLEETPQGYAFGQAALQLAPQFRMSPKIRGGKAVPGDNVTIPIKWKMGNGNVSTTGNSLVMDPPWAKAPTEAEVVAAWPKGVTGVPSAQAALRCDLASTGTLRDCDVISETPANKGFGKAAKALAKSFQVTYSPDDANRLRTITVDVPFRFRAPDLPDARKLTKPRWIDALSPEGMAAVYPEAAIKAGVKKGLGAASCTVSSEGRLVDCQAARETPSGLDFAAAAVKAASVMRMNPWTKEGDAVEGLKITIPFEFTWTETTAAPAKP